MGSVILTKARRVLRTQGVGAVVRGAALHTVNAVRAFRYVSKRPRFATTEAMLDEPTRMCGSVIKSYQVRSEVTQLLNLLQQRAPRVMLEIGTANGGTLFLFTRVCAPDALVVSVDLPGGRFGDGYPLWRGPLYRRFALDRQQIHLIRANSHHTDTVDAVAGLIKGRPLDFLFIDGDHTYEGVKRDFDLYRPLVRPGGLVAFHDVAIHQESSGCGVDRFWREVRAEYRSQEFIADASQGWAGIGVLEVPSE